MTKPVSPLRQRMLDDMKLRNMSRSSQQIYTSAVARFAAFHGRSPDQLGIEHVRQYRLHLLDRGLKATTINPIVGALRFFYKTTLGNKEIAEQIPYARPEDTLPAVLTPDEVTRLFKAVPNFKVRPHGADHHLRRRIARLRGRRAYRPRYQQRAHGHRGPPEQRA